MTALFAMARKYRNLYERLVASTVLATPDDPGSCWLWTGHKSGHYPKITIRINGKPRSVWAHRAMLEEYHDIVFPFDEAAHLCYNTLCINPAHLEVQTQIFNLAMRRGYRPPEGSMIPVLFPRNEHLEVAWDDEGVLVAADAECPF